MATYREPSYHLCAFHYFLQQRLHFGGYVSCQDRVRSNHYPWPLTKSVHRRLSFWLETLLLQFPAQPYDSAAWAFWSLLSWFLCAFRCLIASLTCLIQVRRKFTSAASSRSRESLSTTKPSHSVSLLEALQSPLSVADLACASWLTLRSLWTNYQAWLSNQKHTIECAASQCCLLPNWQLHDPHQHQVHLPCPATMNC